MNGACHAPSSSRTCGTVGGALSAPGKRASTGRGASAGAAKTIAAATETMAIPTVRLFARTRIHQTEYQIGEERAEREKDGAGAGAAGHEKHVSRAQRVEHQLPQTGPRCDHFH